MKFSSYIYSPKNFPYEEVFLGNQYLSYFYLQMVLSCGKKAVFDKLEIDLNNSYATSPRPLDLLEEINFEADTLIIRE